MVFASLNGSGVNLNGVSVPDPAADDGILNAYKLAGFLNSTIEKIEDYRFGPQMGRLYPAAQGEGYFFFVTNKAKAAESLRKTYPKDYAKAFGNFQDEQSHEPLLQKDVTRDSVPLAPSGERALSPKGVFKECSVCPEMVVVPGGSFTMGSTEKNEGPPQNMKIEKPFAVAKFNITVEQFKAFVEETKYDPGSPCYAFEGKWISLQETKHFSWLKPGFEQSATDPVVCVDWNATKAYIGWLREKTGGKDYRLLTETEWEYAARAQTKPGAYSPYSFVCRCGSGASRAPKDNRLGALDSESLACRGGYAPHISCWYIRAQ
jgi:formylglycine-generating enzyme required for sulfatase activity